MKYCMIIIIFSCCRKHNSPLFCILLKFSIKEKHNWAGTVDLSSFHSMQNPTLSLYSWSNIYKAPIYLIIFTGLLFFVLCPIKRTLAREVSEAEIHLILCLPTISKNPIIPASVGVSYAQRKGHLFKIHTKYQLGLISSINLNTLYRKLLLDTKILVIF